jgi:hypothetical protein
MSKIELYYQREGERGEHAIRVAPSATIGQLLAELGIAEGADQNTFVSLEDADEPLPVDSVLAAAGVDNGQRIHVHQCHKIATTIHFNSVEKTREFGPNTTIAHVTKWATGPQGFKMEPTDAAEHELRVTGTDTVPRLGEHLGSLADTQHCAAGFDLVPKHRVEG